MTKRHAGYIVVLEADIRDDDSEEIMKAIRLLRGVVAVSPVETDPHMQMARTNRDIAWGAALRNLASDGPPKPRYERG